MRPGTTSKITAERGPLYQVRKKNPTPNSRVKSTGSRTVRAYIAIGPPMSIPIAVVTMRDESVKRRSQSAIAPPASVPSVPAITAGTASCTVASRVVQPRARAAKLGPHATSPFSPNEIIAPARKTNRSVGVCSTTRKARANSSSTSPIGPVTPGPNGVSAIRSRWICQNHHAMLAASPAPTAVAMTATSAAEVAPYC